VSAGREVRFLLIGALPLSLVNFRGPLLRALRDAGCEVHAAAAAIDDDPAVAAALREMGVTAHSVPIARAGLNPVGDLKALIALVRLMRRIRPTIVLGYTIKPVVWGTLAAWIARVPRRYAMITGLGYAFTGEAKGKRAGVQKVARGLYRLALSRAHRAFFQNPDDLALFRQLGLIAPDKPVTIVNGSGVDLTHYPQQPLPAGPPRFLMIARLLGDKGVREYAAAAMIVRRRHPDASFHLVGPLDSNPDGIGEEEVKTWTASGDVVWHGIQYDVRPFLADTHVFVLPSYREGTPRTVLEAMATGRPVITTDAPGCRETVIDGENGFLVPPRSAEALADAMLRLLAAPSMIDDMAVRSLDLVRNKYAADKVTAVMLDAMGVTDESGI
jgi:glycosyltransferase involved in cell wall biosynthesis